jgi:hypothetical protein
MRNGSYAQISPEAVAEKLSEARALFREARIDTTARMSLTDAALAAGVSTDELLAVLEDRARRNARRARSAEAARAEAEALEAEFMLI